MQQIFRKTLKMLLTLKLVTHILKARVSYVKLEGGDYFVTVKRRHAPYNKFKAFLAENDIKQHDLAAALDKSVSAVNQNLNGTGGDFSIEEVRKLCFRYGISSDEYFIYSQVSNMKHGGLSQHQEQGVM